MKEKKMYILLVLLLFFSCKKEKQFVHEEFVNLYPDKELIRKQYYKYSLQDPFSPNDTLYTPIEPSSKSPKMAKTLIKATEPYDLHYFNKFIRDKMGGEYSDYIFKNDKILYRYYYKHYNKNDYNKNDSREKIEQYFKKQSINYKFLRSNEDNNLIYLLKKKGQSSPAFCVIDLHDNILEVYLTYNSNDTIMSLSQKSLRPFRGSEIED